MAYATKYRLQIADYLGTVWDVQIQKDSYVGSVTDMTGAGEPIEFEFYGDDDLFEQHILGSKVSLKVICNTDFEYAELFTSNNLEYKVLIYHGVTLYWQGFILVNDYKEPYDCVPFPVTLTATDGLGLLKDFKFEDLNYSTRQKASQIIHDILDLVGITTFTEYVNVYGNTMTGDVDNSPFDQFGIDPDVFKTDDCYTALEEILSLFNAGIRQDQSVFTIFRFKELRDTTMYGRIFTDGTTHSSTTKTPAQYISRSGQASNFKDREGGSRTQIPQIKTLYLNYDCGVKESCLKHWDFQYEDFVYSGGAWSIEDWTLESVAIAPLADYLSGESNGVYIVTKATSILDTKYIYQYLGGVETRTPSWKVSFDYRILSTADSQTAYVRYLLYITDGITTKYWDGSGWDLAGAPPDVTAYTKSVNIGWTEWETQDINIPNIPFAGELRLLLYAVANAGSNCNIAYRNVRVQFTPSVGGSDIGIGYTVSAATNGQIKEKDFRLGDGFTTARYAVNQLLSYKGVINGYSGATIIDPGTTWNTLTAGVSNGQDDPLVELIGGELGGQYERAKDLIDLPVRETDASAFLSLTGNLQDKLNQYSSANRVFGITRARYMVKMREWELTLCEVL